MGDRATTSTGARIVGIVLTLVVAAAAGGGGWVAYDHYLADEASASASDDATPDGNPAAAAADPAADLAAPETNGAMTTPALGDGAPWPADVTMPTAGWTSFRYTVQPQDDIVRQMVDFDPVTNKAKVTLLDPEGAVSSSVEIHGFDVWLDQGDGWEQPDDFMRDFMAAAAFVVPQRTLADLFPPAVWPYTTLLVDEPATEPDLVGGRRLVFVVDNAAFSLAQPIAAAEWRDTTGTSDPGFDPTLAWTFELDADGHIRLFTPEARITFRYSELTTPPIFTSPLAS